VQDHQTPNKVTRRRILSLIAGSTCFAVQSRVPLFATPSGASHLRSQAHAAAVLKTSSPAFFNEHQLDTIAGLAELIIPADQHSPGARAAGVDQFINEIVAVSEEATQKLWTDGLKALDELARLASGQEFLHCSEKQQLELLTQISQREASPETLEERFFVALKQSAIDGYYLSEIGIHEEMEYQGNTVLAEFPGCIHEEHTGGCKAGQ
jgi:hypothetical protein